MTLNDINEDMCVMQESIYMVLTDSRSGAYDVISDAIRPGSTIREDHIDTPYRETLCSNIV